MRRRRQRFAGSWYDWNREFHVILIVVVGSGGDGGSFGGNIGINETIERYRRRFRQPETKVVRR